MKMKSQILALAVAALSLAPSVASAAAGSFPSHCKSNEYALLNSKMSVVVHKPAGGYELKPLTGKILSLCADKATEPFGRLYYRYGVIGKVELEQVADASHPFNIFTRSPVPRIGENIIFFSKNGYTYYVTEAFAMGSGISLDVFQGNKQIAELFSGNDREVDFNSHLMDLQFDKAASPVFVIKAPVHKLR